MGTNAPHNKGQAIGEGVTTLSCLAHKQPLVTRRDVGMLRYYHVDDNSPCDLLNSLSTTVADVLAASVTALEASPLARMGFLLSPAVRMTIYQQLSRSNDVTIVTAYFKLLNTWLDIQTKPQVEIVQEMTRYFGVVAVNNLEAVCPPGTNLTMYKRYAPMHPPQDGLPLLDIVKARQSKVLTTLAQEEQEDYKIQQQRVQAELKRLTRR